MAKPRLLLIGDFNTEEFAPVATGLCNRAEVSRAADVPEAMDMVTANFRLPDAMVLAYPRPGAFGDDELYGLRRAAPLARQLAVLGTWCEGESRSGRVIPGLIRTYWHQWLPRWVDELEACAGGRLPLWGLPETSGDDERLLHRAGRPSSACDGLIAIASRSFDTAEMLLESCRRYGYATVWLRPREPLRVHGALAVLWDSSGGRASELAALRQAARAPVVALMDFPRAEDVRELEAAGAAAVLAKPVVLGDLFWQLGQLTRRSASANPAGQPRGMG